MLDSREVLKKFKALSSTGVPIGTLRGALQAAGHDASAVAEGIESALSDRSLVMDTSGMVREGQRLAHFTDTYIGLTDPRLSDDARQVLQALVTANMRTPGPYKITETDSKKYGLTPAGLGKLMAAQQNGGRIPYAMPMLVDSLSYFGAPPGEAFPDRHDAFEFKMAVHIID